MSSDTPWHGQSVEAIPEFFAKPGMVENLATAHPALLVRQMANEILRLRSAPSEKTPNNAAAPQVPTMATSGFAPSEDPGFSLTQSALSDCGNRNGAVDCPAAAAAPSSAIEPTDSQDAIRYRYLRDHAGMYGEQFHIMQLVGKEFTRAYRWGRRLDDEVDDAMRRDKAHAEYIDRIHP